MKYRDPRGLDDADREWENRINPPRPNPNPWYWSHNESADNGFEYRSPSNPEKCSCNKDSDDVRKMKGIFNSSVYRMTDTGQRHTNPYWNNFWSTFGASYLGCGQQADIVTSDLQVGFPNQTWQFQIQTGFTPLYHQWGQATSNNPDDPIISYDPWHDEFEVKCRCER